ncbi:hypothetical protein [Streptomyces sp. NPDC060194]
MPMSATVRCGVTIDDGLPACFSPAVLLAGVLFGAIRAVPPVFLAS